MLNAKDKSHISWPPKGGVHVPEYRPCFGEFVLETVMVDVCGIRNESEVVVEWSEMTTWQQLPDGEGFFGAR